MTWKMIEEMRTNPIRLWVTQHGLKRALLPIHLEYEWEEERKEHILLCSVEWREREICWSGTTRRQGSLRRVLVCEEAQWHLLLWRARAWRVRPRWRRCSVATKRPSCTSWIRPIFWTCWLSVAWSPRSTGQRSPRATTDPAAPTSISSSTWSAPRVSRLFASSAMRSRPSALTSFATFSRTTKIQTVQTCLFLFSLFFFLYFTFFNFFNLLLKVQFLFWFCFGFSHFFQIKTKNKRHSG